MDFLQKHILEVSLIISVILSILCCDIISNLIVVIMAFTIFILGVYFKQSAVIDLTNVILLNCLTLTILISMFLQYFKYVFIQNKRRQNCANIKKI